MHLQRTPREHASTGARALLARLTRTHSQVLVRSLLGGAARPTWQDVADRTTRLMHTRRFHCYPTLHGGHRSWWPSVRNRSHMLAVRGVVTPAPPCSRPATAVPPPCRRRVAAVSPLCATAASPPQVRSFRLAVMANLGGRAGVRRLVVFELRATSRVIVNQADLVANASGSPALAGAVRLVSRAFPAPPRPRPAPPRPVPPRPIPSHPVPSRPVPSRPTGAFRLSRVAQRGGAAEAGGHGHRPRRCATAVNTAINTAVTRR